ncbi:hypothetical protein [Pontibacter sp. G13]|uniref:hypothetical protein n=1 Tax=Pontibacter sp. G13 TaxID=3074898 RepID=UPI00288A5AC1|nr:hypothetical protein [Pontibacter sp. G13]WNJ20320.1 hypothetical protein RJD25_07555 [Pontibacter sp. G13]
MIFQHSLYHIRWAEDKQILELVWKPTTQDLVAEEFQAALHNFAGFGATYGVSSMLQDMRDFMDYLPPELLRWRDIVVSPRYRQFGLQKMAFLYPPEMAPKNMGNAPIQIRGYAEEFFDVYESATDWLLTDIRPRKAG